MRNSIQVGVRGVCDREPGCWLDGQEAEDVCELEKGLVHAGVSPLNY